MTSFVDSKRRLIWHGTFLFLLGLLTGFVEQQFNNPRMGLAAHLEGVMNGTFRKMIADTMGSRSWSVYRGRLSLTADPSGE